MNTVRDLALRIAPIAAAVAIVGAASHLAGTGAVGIGLALLLIFAGLGVAGVAGRDTRRRP